MINAVYGDTQPVLFEAKKSTKKVSFPAVEMFDFSIPFIRHYRVLRHLNPRDSHPALLTTTNRQWCFGNSLFIT